MAASSRSSGRSAWATATSTSPGSGVVHSIGGWAALAGAIVLGPRIGKFNKDGSSNTILGHNQILAILGTFILAFGWFGFNPGSTFGASGNGALRIGIIAVVTMLASGFGAFAAMVYTWWTEGKPNPAMMANGMLAGLVAITAPSGYVGPIAAAVIGVIAGVLVCLAVAFFDRIHIDDPVGAISVHGVNGLWGVLATGIFADGTANYGGFQVTGLLYGNVGQFGAQVVGAVVAFVWAFGASYDLLQDPRPVREDAGQPGGRAGRPGHPRDGDGRIHPRRPAGHGLTRTSAWADASRTCLGAVGTAASRLQTPPMAPSAVGSRAYPAGSATTNRLPPKPFGSR